MSKKEAEKIKKVFRSIRLGYVALKVRMNRGMSLLGDFVSMVNYTALATMLANLINQRFHTNIDLGMVMFYTPLLLILAIVIGDLDIRKLHVLQVENEYNTRLNPVFEKMDKRIRKINKRSENNKLNSKLKQK